MAATAHYQRNKSHTDMFYNYPGTKRNNYSYNTRQNSTMTMLPLAKMSFNAFDNSPKKAFMYDNNNKSKQTKINTSGYSTMASEADQEPELAGIKIMQSGKILLDVQSDSDSFSPVRRTGEKKELCFASATNYLGPCPREISVPSFL
jgi:hypothetical protein